MKIRIVPIILLLITSSLHSVTLFDTKKSIRLSTEKLKQGKLSSDQATQEYQKALQNINELNKQQIPTLKMRVELESAYKQNTQPSELKRAVATEKIAPIVTEETAYSKKRLIPAPGSQMAQPVGIIRQTTSPSFPMPASKQGQPISISRPASPSQGKPTSLLEQIRQGAPLKPAQERVLAPKVPASDQGTQLKKAVEERLQGLEKMQRVRPINEGSGAPDADWE